MDRLRFIVPPHNGHCTSDVATCKASMPVLNTFLKNVIFSLTLLCFSNFLIGGIPINNGFSIKFNPASAKEQVKPKSFGALFAKIPQEQTGALRRELFSDAIFAHPAQLANGCTNQIAKMLYPLKMALEDENVTRTSQSYNFINLPIIKQPSDFYNVLVATAPKNIKLDKKGEALSTVLYVVFPGEETDEMSKVNLPTIYFVNKVDGSADMSKKEKDSPIFIIDNNRTVTGLKSKEVSKFVRFKNKLRNLYTYEVPRE